MNLDGPATKNLSSDGELMRGARSIIAQLLLITDPINNCDRRSTGEINVSFARLVVGTTPTWDPGNRLARQNAIYNYCAESPS